MVAKKPKAPIAILILLALTLTGVTIGLASGNYDLSWWSVDSGGALLSTTGDYTLSGTMGQLDAGGVLKSSSGTYGLVSGFWGASLSSSMSETLPILLTAQPGYTSVELSWTSTNDPYVSTYRVSRAVSRTLDYMTIATTANTKLYDADPALKPDTRYCYRVEALRPDNQIARASSLACTNFGQLSLWVPDVWAGPGVTATIPINIENAQDLPLAVADIWLGYDETILRPIDVSATSLTHAYAWTYTIVTTTVPHQVRLTTQGGATPPRLHGEGSLFWLSVEVLGQTGDSGALNLREYIEGVGGSAIYAPDDLAQTIPLLLKDGLLHVEDVGLYRLGDLNGDSSITAIDAYTALQIGAGQIVATPKQVNAGDINGDSLVNSADASMILHYAAHNRWPGLGLGVGSSYVQVDPAITLGLEDVRAQPGDTVEVAMTIENVTAWAGADLVVAYDRQLIDDVVAVMLGDFGQVFDLRYHDSGVGLLHISAADEVGVSGTGEVLKITFALSDYAQPGAVSPLAISEASLYDNVGRDFMHSALQHKLEKQPGSIAIDAAFGATIYLPLMVR